MGCKCTRDLFFGENEVIRVQSKNSEKSFKTGEKPLSKSKYLSNKNNSEYIIVPEVRIINKSKEEKASIYTTDKKESINNLSIEEDLKTPIKQINNNTYTLNGYAQEVLSLINKIRLDPKSYSHVIEESIQNIKRTKNNKIIYFNVVKVALLRGEEAFHEAAEKIKNIEPMNPLEFDPNLCIPLPDNEDEFKSQEFFKDKVEKMREKNINVEIYYRDLVRIPEISVLLMIVDDNNKTLTKKRNTLLNKNLKYIGVCSKWIGKKFVAHFSFSR